jgi:hypothetical protein
MLRMQPKLLAALAADPERVAGRLIELKSLLPLADVAAIAAQRPSLLLDGEWERVAGGAAQLAAVYAEAEVAKLASSEPLLLVEDLQHILAELQRCECGMGVFAMPGCGLCVHACSLRRVWSSGQRQQQGHKKRHACCPAAPPWLAGSCRSKSPRRRCCGSPAWPATSAACPTSASGSSSSTAAHNLCHRCGCRGCCRRSVGAGADARVMLLRDPGMVYSVQRGTQALGPGAEF